MPSLGPDVYWLRKNNFNLPWTLLENEKKKFPPYCESDVTLITKYGMKSTRKEKERITSFFTIYPWASIKILNRVLALWTQKCRLRITYFKKSKSIPGLEVILIFENT